MRLILASSSPRRRELLAKLNLQFEVIKPEIDESLGDGELLVDYVRRLSREKAEAVARTLDNSSALILAADTIVIAADTIGVDEAGDLLGKPTDAADARRMLRRLRGRAHDVITAFTLHRHGAGATVITRQERTVVHMRHFSDAEIDAYIETGDPLDKAGSYAIQNEAFHPVERIEGSYSNVVGLPLEALKTALGEIGFVFLS